MANSEQNWEVEVAHRLQARNEEVYSVSWYYTVNELSKKNEYWKSRAEALAEGDAKKLSCALDAISTLNQELKLKEFDIHKKESLNHELMVHIGEIKQQLAMLKESNVKFQKKAFALYEEVQMNKKAVEMANDHILELEMENNMLQLKLDDKR
ncbi:hypothetical protein DAMA08_050200 [Martiniozyma asiatica (nom. inval.)]|nr:hypothetical protein DAMA08_050200 [Martiniozyma asiatica]